MALNTVKVDLPAEIFEAPVSVPLIHQVVVAQLAAARQGTHKTKNRGEVSGSGVKPFKQKGTGRSRQGSVRAPEHRGGGVVHGPTPRDYSQRTNKKMKAAALKGALSDRAANGRIHVADLAFEKPSTKAAAAGLAGLTDRTKFLVVLDRAEVAAWLSFRNLPKVHIVAADQLNTYDVLNAEDVVFSTAAYAAFTGVEVAAVPAKKTAAKKTAAKKAAAAESVEDEK
jgi:large subunit ribosomal protein L4